MLTIPNSIKTLFKTDGTRKNFRVKFPNNELPDITNENIVRESVHFTESICSQSTFRFGLAEASVIEFETVGIGNMYGYTISCSYEIDTSSLSASEISNIQSDPGDGELVLASSSDIGYGFYRVPLGVFRVERCPRNHGAMTHRQVTGYSVHPGGVYAMSPIEALKTTNWWGISAQNEPNFQLFVELQKFIHANIGYFDPGYLSFLGYAETSFFEFSSISTSNFSSSNTMTGSDGATYKIQYSGTYKRRNFQLADSSTLWGLDIGDSDYRSIYDTLAGWFSEYGLNPADLLDEKTFSAWIATHATYVLPRLHWGDAQEYNVLLEDAPVFDPFVGYHYPSFDATKAVSLLFPYSVTLTITRNSVSVGSFSFTAGSEEPVVTKWQTSETFLLDGQHLYLSQSSTRQTAGNGTLFQFFDTIDYEKLTGGYFELLGMFEKTDRKGGEEFVALSPSSPISISPGDYDECWWDEYDVSPIGTVTVTYRNGEEGEATANVTLGAGASLYDMTDNEVLKNLSTAALDSITTLLSGDFASNAENVGFTPIEMTMQGFPWLEAGDALQITAEDGTVVNTYALRVEMSGIQHLMSDITAEGGEIIGEV